MLKFVLQAKCKRNQVQFIQETNLHLGTGRSYKLKCFKVPEFDSSISRTCERDTKITMIMMMVTPQPPLNLVFWFASQQLDLVRTPRIYTHLAIGNPIYQHPENSCS